MFHQDIRDFVLRNDLPEELFHLDLLDGSPPCSSFSMTGNRDKDWGKEKVFKEGQAKQKLDDLFFTYIELAKKLQPKVIIAENVKGLLHGNAKVYVKNIINGFKEAGYNVQFFLLNSASMGVPQRRERVFFICHRKDLKYPKLAFNFNEKAIVFSEISDILDNKKNITAVYEKYWDIAKEGKSVGKFHTKRKVAENTVVATLTANSSDAWHNKYKRPLNTKELCFAGSYPLDYNFKKVKPFYLIGMSVPPVMTAQIAHQVYLQWLK